ncbi:MAG: Lar family restriction alleviation protein [Oscillospiraceae bacterium]|nr:Lar family restriction alleviation protein [Oscillospiraceae bacterium]
MELKNCPFCGGSAEVKWDNRQRDGHAVFTVRVRCTNCGASTRSIEGNAAEPVQGNEELWAERLWNGRR